MEENGGVGREEKDPEEVELEDKEKEELIDGYFDVQRAAKHEGHIQGDTIKTNKKQQQQQQQQKQQQKNHQANDRNEDDANLKTLYRVVKTHTRFELAMGVLRGVGG